MDKKLVEKGELSREELRQPVLLVVERVEAPIIMDGVPIRPDKKTPTRFFKLTLPHSEARNLLGRLGALGVTATELFPGYEGAARAARVNNYGLQTYAQNQQGVSAWNEEFVTKHERLASMMSFGQVRVIQTPEGA